jgi:hypothetical protein
MPIRLRAKQGMCIRVFPLFMRVWLQRSWLLARNRIGRSKLYIRALRDTRQFAGWSGRVLVAGTRGREKEEGSNKVTTGLQDACNLLATSGALWHCYGVARVPLGGHDGVVPAERPRCCAIRAPPRVVVSAGDADALRSALPACQPQVANLTCAFSWKKSLSSVRAALA